MSPSSGGGLRTAVRIGTVGALVAFVPILVFALVRQREPATLDLVAHA